MDIQILRTHGPVEIIRNVADAIGHCKICCYKCVSRKAMDHVPYKSLRYKEKKKDCVERRQKRWKDEFPRVGAAQ
jgi:hypothetical protein